jgi:DNA-binding Xre family transcriptional regulator
VKRADRYFNAECIMANRKKLELDWRLHAVMADRGIKFAKELQDALTKDGCAISASSISRLVYKIPKQLDIKLLSSLCRVLACTPDELLLPRQEQSNDSESARGKG